MRTETWRGESKLPEQELGFDASLNKVLRIAIRRRWWLLLPATVIALAGCAASLVLPNRYKSEATILVERQQVPERYVTANTTIDVQEALASTADAILSRTQLLKIIDEFGLYPKERKLLAPEQLVGLMRLNIKTEALEKGSEPRDLNAFTISFTGADPRKAQQVCTKLTTLFIEESDKSREQQSAGTTNFLSNELDAAAADLKQQETRVSQFKMQYLGELPEQQQGNLAILGGLHSELQNTMATLARAREQQVYLQSLLSQYENMSPAATLGPAAVAADPQQAIKAELVQLRSKKADLLSRYTAEYPDVVKIDEQIKATEAQLVASTPPSDAKKTAGPSANPPAAAVTGNATTAQVKSQLEANHLEIENALADQKQVEVRIADYQRRLNLTPVREAALADLLRDYNQSKQHYDDMLSKKTQSSLATSLEMHQQGQRFNIIDPPSLPMKPASPDHVKISLAGLMAGIAVGAALAFWAETKDHSLRDEQELRGMFAFPLMVGLPRLQTDGEQRKRSRRVVFEWLLATAMCLLVCATEFYIYRRR
jgi:succinoglycan biosynthesis transport protein ExoP